jgi:2-polyprenyl-3-methyl-5-hydroxy-6-metoxy-1,4-benzoquinol methylase
MHVPFEQICLAAHACPHIPQLFGSTMTFVVHIIPASLSGGGGEPESSSSIGATRAQASERVATNATKNRDFILPDYRDEAVSSATTRYARLVGMDRHYLQFAAAWVRGARPELTRESDGATVDAAIAEGVRLHRFKRMDTLPRVQRVIGILRSFAPKTLLDVGTGRGAFLWPLLDEIEEIEVTCLDVLDYRVADIEAVRRGGIERVRGVHGDICANRSYGSFDVVTMLEVLEHLPNPKAAASLAMRMAKSAVIITVPSKEDDNPEHIHLFDAASLRDLFSGARKIDVDGVRGHLVAMVRP